MLILCSAINKQDYQVTMFILSYIVLDAKTLLPHKIEHGFMATPFKCYESIPHWLGNVSCASLDTLFSLNKGKVGALLVGLHSVLDVPDNDDKNIRILHASFGDFLVDPKRSGRYFVDASVEAIAEQKAFYFVRCLSVNISNVLSDYS
jgi:hypothetical protein